MKVNNHIVFFFLIIISLQSCMPEDKYYNLSDDAKEFLFFELDDTFKLRNLSTDEIITLKIISKEIEHYADGGISHISFGPSADVYIERGEYIFTDDSNCYTGSVIIEARRDGSFEFSIRTGDCFGEYLATPEFNSLKFEFSDEIISINVNGIEYTKTYILNTVNNAIVNTIFYTKEKGIIQINDNQSTVFTITE